MAAANKHAKSNQALKDLYAEMRPKGVVASRRCLGPGKEHYFQSRGNWNRICPACVAGDHYSTSPQFAEAMPVHDYQISKIRPGYKDEQLQGARDRFLKRVPKKVSK